MGKTIRNTKTKTDESKYKSKVRSRVAWKNFRERLRKERKVDALTNMKLNKGWELHHLNLNIAEYDKFIDENFECLNTKSHDVVHFLYTYYRKDAAILDRLKAILDKMVALNEEPTDVLNTTEKTEKN